MIEKIKRFLRFDTRDKLIALSAVILLPITNTTIKTLGFNRTRGFLRQLVKCVPIKTSSRTPFEIASFVYSAQKVVPFGGNCLPRSLVIHQILSTLGVDSEIRFGQKFVDKEIKGHAWVKCEDGALAKVDEDLESYQPFDRPIPN